MENIRYSNAMRGSWNGQLIDIGGREGQITFTLRGTEKSVAGVFDVLIFGQHHPTRIHGVVTGKLTSKNLSLKLDTNQKESSVAVQFEGCLTLSATGGWSTCGRYAVTSRQSAALIGGVMSARQIVAPRKGENVARREVTATLEAGRPPRAAAARAAKSPRARPATRKARSKK